MRHYLSICIIVSVSLTETSAQLAYEWETRAENWEYRVKNIEFFIDRFNNQPEGSGSAHAANPKDTAACLAFMKERDSKMFSLFDRGKLDKNDAVLKQKINTFFREVNSPYQPKFIRFEDTFWYAELTMMARAGGQSQKLRCILQVVRLGQGGAQGWVIKSVHSSDLQVDERFRGNELYFPPSVNGTDFMNVRLALNDPAWLNERSTKLVGKSRLLEMLKEGKLKIDTIGKITYHFLQLDGWILTVNYVNRESKNSGWLLDALRQATNQQKVEYLKDLSAD